MGFHFLQELELRAGANQIVFRVIHLEIHVAVEIIATVIATVLGTLAAIGIYRSSASFRRLPKASR